MKPARPLASAKQTTQEVADETSLLRVLTLDRKVGPILGEA